jgi:hypothetical protein
MKQTNKQTNILVRIQRSLRYSEEVYVLLNKGFDAPELQPYF